MLKAFFHRPGIGVIADQRYDHETGEQQGADYQVCAEQQMLLHTISHVPFGGGVIRHSLQTGSSA
ncbi:hypothetical protein SDC9_135444 [bioreactor metagenome]|uniref:Uncharacterized protein n=1 Tax=bioreactor metagenome TaxID=1076179 RepID=A0A645DIB9_9ZZZZ